MSRRSEPHYSNIFTGKTGLSCSYYGRLELWNTISRHNRENRITERDFQIVSERLRSDEEHAVWTWLNISKDVIFRACEIVESITEGSFIRSADALHVACASEYGFKTVYSHDRIMLEVADHFGLKGLDILK